MTLALEAPSFGERPQSPGFGDGRCKVRKTHHRNSAVSRANLLCLGYDMRPLLATWFPVVVSQYCIHPQSRSPHYRSGPTETQHHMSSPAIQARRVDTSSAGVVRPRNRITLPPEARRVDTSVPIVSQVEFHIVLFQKVQGLIIKRMP